MADPDPRKVDTTRATPTPSVLPGNTSAPDTQNEKGEQPPNDATDATTAAPTEKPTEEMVSPGGAGYAELRTEDDAEDESTGRFQDNKLGGVVELRGTKSTDLHGGPSNSEAQEEDGRGSGDAGAVVGHAVEHEYKVYKRRWFGLVQLTLLNIIVSWDVS